MDMFPETRLVPPAQPDEHVRWLEERIGVAHTAARLAGEEAAERWETGPAIRRLRNPSRIVDMVAPVALIASGLIRPARRNARRISVTRHEVAIAGLPPSFDGFTILHLTDLHADQSEAAVASIPAAIAGLHYDACAMTGDFRGKNYGPHARAAAIVRNLLPHIRKPVFGVLGNHDTVLLVRDFERAGMRMLMNEAEPIRHHDGRLWIAGVDDPHHYRLHDLGKAMRGIPPGEPVILLSHSTDGYQAAAAAGVGLMLCGHTHGGQICLPGGLPVVTSSRQPRHLASGRWQHGGMAGYTSRGIGTSVIEARFNCPPEAALLVLRRPRDPEA